MLSDKELLFCSLQVTVRSLLCSSEPLLWSLEPIRTQSALWLIYTCFQKPLIRQASNWGGQYWAMRTPVILQDRLHYAIVIKHISLYIYWKKSIFCATGDWTLPRFSLKQTFARGSSLEKISMLEFMVEK